MIDVANARKLALSFPEAEERDHQGHPSFRVRGKIFATLWPDEQRVAQRQSQMMGLVPSATWFQQQLALLGYSTPQTGQLDVATRHVLAAFQMHYRPQKFDGEPDLQSAAILQVLNLKN